MLFVSVSERRPLMHRAGLGLSCQLGLRNMTKRRHFLASHRTTGLPARSGKSGHAVSPIALSPKPQPVPPSRHRIFTMIRQIGKVLIFVALPETWTAVSWKRAYGQSCLRMEGFLLRSGRGPVVGGALHLFFRVCWVFQGRIT